MTATGGSSRSGCRYPGMKIVSAHSSASSPSATWYERPSPPVTGPGCRAARAHLVGHALPGAEDLRRDADVERLRPLEHEHGDAVVPAASSGQNAMPRKDAATCRRAAPGRILAPCPGQAR